MDTQEPNGYVPKVGDKVKATLGENVLVGGVASTNGGDITIWVKHDEHETAVYIQLNPRLWHFEQLVSVPTKFGAVIRRADGEVFSFTAPGQKPCPWLGRDGWRDELYAVMGGFTVLFDGVDE
jgi:hypothetical protein